MTERKSNLGKILKGISTKKDSEKPSVVEVINRACEKGVTSTGAFSLLGIKRQLKLLLRLLDSDDFNKENLINCTLS